MPEPIREAEDAASGVPGRRDVRHAFHSSLLAPPAATATATAVVAPGAATALAPAAAGARRLGRAEVAELLGRLGLPCVLERHDFAAGSFGRCRCRARRAAVALARRGSGRFAVLADRGEGDLALLVDVVDPNLELVAQVEHVLHPLHSPALAQLGDVDQAVTARE